MLGGDGEYLLSTEAEDKDDTVLSGVGVKGLLFAGEGVL